MLVIYFVISVSYERVLERFIEKKMFCKNDFLKLFEIFRDRRNIRLVVKKNGLFAYVKGIVEIPDKVRYTYLDIFRLAHEVGHAIDAIKRKNRFRLLYHARLFMFVSWIGLVLLMILSVFNAQLIEFVLKWYLLAFILTLPHALLTLIIEITANLIAIQLMSVQFELKRTIQLKMFAFLAVFDQLVWQMVWFIPLLFLASY